MRVQTGGKLYLAGEYAVLSPGQGAVIQFIPIYMQAEIAQADHYQLQSDMFDFAVDMTPQPDYALIQESVQLMEDFLTLQGKSIQPFHLQLSGKFERNGKKFGIGSSGSVVLLTLKAMATLYQLPLTADQLFRLASLVLIKRGDNGSMGDLACIAYEDLVYYQSFDRGEIAEQVTSLPLDALLDLDWGYVIDPIQPQISYDFLVGWTQQPAISKDLVNQVKSAITEDFLSASQAAVLAVYQGLKEGNQSLLQTNLETASQLLSSLSPAIYTQKLAQLKAAEQGLNVVAKSSGAGGGDCGIALSFDQSSSQQLIERWQAAGIDLLYQERKVPHE